MKKIILDTDIGGDCDDVLALDYLLSAMNKNEAELICVTCCTLSRYSTDCVRSICTQYGYTDIPVCTSAPKTGDDDVYAHKVHQKFPVKLPYKTDRYENPVKMLRRMLALSDEKVTIAATGPLTNIAALLESPPDEYAALDGVTLVRLKVAEIAIMGGYFGYQTGINPIDGDKMQPIGEWNIICDVKAAQTVVASASVPLVFSPYEVGMNMITGADMVSKYGETTPSSYAYVVHGSTLGRHSWDPTTALYAVKGADPWFELTPPGVIKISDKGITEYGEVGGGNHYYLKCKMPQKKIAEEIDNYV
jgi:inosine-uridine nucleoside N-ribohydrolase